MPSKMLIDAAHPEETRVVAVKGNRVEEFDYESANKKQLRGNIYLAKVTRVEPSLQAAFVDYGGNRHGFLAFTEIHPDYYQIPVADRQALLEDEAEEHSRASAGRGRRGRRGCGRAPPARRTGGAGATRAKQGRERPNESERPGPAETIAVARLEIDDEIDTTPPRRPPQRRHGGERTHPRSVGGRRTARRRATRRPRQSCATRRNSTTTTTTTEHGETVGQPVAMKEGNGDAVTETVESVGSEDALEELPERSRRRRGRPLQDPGGHQAPPDHPGAGGEGRARQ